MLIYLSLISFVFFIGSIPFGYIIGKLWLGLDITVNGSGNIGMTNVIRVGGKLPGAITFLLDFLKGVFCVYLVNAAFDRYIPSATLINVTIDQSQYLYYLALITPVLGHVYSIFLKFKGGKGISTTLGVLLIINPIVWLVSVLSWIMVFILWRISSLSGLISLLMIPISLNLLFLFNLTSINLAEVLLFSILSVILIYRHKDNINRLISGNEKKLVPASNSVKY